MIRFIKNIWNPEVFHQNNQKVYFEGWYFKNVSAKHNNSLAIIPGIFRNETETYAFIQILDGNSKKSHFIKFKYDDFEYSSDKFDIKIGKNFFNLDFIKLDIERDNYRIFGQLNFKNHHPWEIERFSPGAMGWYGFVPFMECNHAVLSFNNQVTGKILVNNNVYIFTKDKGYIEKDWGKSFPSSYIWMQSNSFTDPDLSLFLSIAKIPWLGNSFTGFIVGFYTKDKFYKFATYTGAKILKLKVENDFFDIIIQDKDYIIEIKANKKIGGELNAPYSGSMAKRINESMNSSISIILSNRTKNSKRIIIEDDTNLAGIEFVGKIEELLK